MSAKLSCAAYERLIAEDLGWLMQQPRTLERDHIAAVLAASAGHEYGGVATLRAELATVRLERDSARSGAERISEDVIRLERERDELRLRLEAELQCANDKREWALAAEHERDQQRERADRLVNLLWGCEWGPAPHIALSECPWCLSYKRDGHRPDCELGAALRGEASGPNAAPRKDDQRCSCSHPSYVHHQVLPTGEHTHCLTMCGCESFTVATASPATTDEG